MRYRSFKQSIGAKIRTVKDQTDRRADLPQRPTTDNRDAWGQYWRGLGQGWRTEPEIEEIRLQELTHRLDLAQGAGTTTAPFKGMSLRRADVEWLLGTHEHGRGPVRWNDPGDSGREGLDLRGANLAGEDLTALPLAALRAGTNASTSLDVSTDLREACLTGSDLRGAGLEGALLTGAHFVNALLEQAHLEGANISNTQFEHADLMRAHMEGVTSIHGPAHLNNARLLEAHMEGAILGSARMEGADLTFAHLERVYLARAHLENADLSSAHLEGADLRNVHLEGARLIRTCVGGKVLDADDLERVRKWSPSGGFPRALPPANLREAFLDNATRLEDIRLGDAEHGIPQLADVHWSGANLAVIDWNPAVNNLGDERVARDLEKRKTRNPRASSSAAILRDYQAAVRANRQLAIALREQGMNEVADDFAYRAQTLQRRVYELHEVYGFQQQPTRLLLYYFLEMIAGYGYKPYRTLASYIVVVAGCALLYYILGESMTVPDAVVGSITAFHGRGLFEAQLTSGQGMIAALEAFLGLIIEVVLIATITWRFFGR